MSSAYKPTSKSEMLAAFPPSVPAIVGQPSLKEMIRLLMHLITCSQSHHVEYGNGLNLLHICLPEHLYQRFVADPANQPYPHFANDPGDLPAHNAGGNAMVWSNEKLQWERAKMVYRDELNMDKALTDRLLQLTPSEYKQEFTLRLQTEPNMRFQDAFQYFVTRYTQADEHDRSENKATMDWDWTINDNFPVIVNG